MPASTVLHEKIEPKINVLLEPNPQALENAA